MPFLIPEKFLPKDHNLPLREAPGRDKNGQPTQMAVITGSTLIGDLVAIIKPPTSKKNK